MRDQRGQITTALVIIVTVGLCAVAFLGVWGLSRGVDERSKAQSAADAAALAGADALENLLPTALGALLHKNDLSSLFHCNFGRAQAQEYAAKNRATLTDYCFNGQQGEVTAEVEMNDPVTDDIGPASAGAVASIGFSFGDCSWDDDEPPTPTPTPTPTTTPTPGPPPPPPPPPDFGTTLKCGPLEVSFIVDGTTGGLALGHVDLDLEPELVN